MPARAYKAGGLKNSRTASGGSSKIGLNLHFTQKDPTHPTAGRAGTRTHNGHTTTDVHHARGKDTHVRTNSAVRLDKGKDKEREPPAPAPHVVRRTSSGKGQARPRRSRTDFSIASPSTEDSDEDEWVSSEAPSGAATPRQAESDDESSEDESDEGPILAAVKTHPKESKRDPAPAPAMTPRTAVVPLAQVTSPTPTEEVPTRQLPRGVTPPLPPGISGRRRSPSPPQPQRRAPSPPRKAAIPQQPRPPPVDTSITTTPPKISSPPPPSPGSKRAIRSATTSPRAASAQSTRHALTRPPSTHSITSRADAPLRPHPLIRAQSYGRDALAPPARLAPLTATSTPISASPPQSLHVSHNGGRLSSSPESMHTLDGSLTPASPAFARAPQIALSSPAPAAEFSVPGGPGATGRIPFPGSDRKRTLSTMSTASGASLAALASLAGHGTSQTSHHHRPAPLPLTVHFPPAPQPGVLEALHPLLPQPYLGQHLSALQLSNPMKESYARVMRAKHGW